MIAVVTGATRGLGLALCSALREQGQHTVVGLCRARTSELEAAADVVLAGADLGDERGVAAAIAAVRQLCAEKGQRIALWINNAGVGARGGLGEASSDEMLAAFRVNAVAPVVLVQGVLDLLCSDAKVVNISSQTASCAQNESGGLYAYRASKAALNIASVSLAVDLRPRGVAVLIIHPGLVRTDLIRPENRSKATPPATAAESILARIAELTLETSGRFVHAQDGEQIPW